MDSRVAPRAYCEPEIVRKFIADYAGVDLKRVTNEAHLTDDLNLDWLDQLELMVLIEDEFVGVHFFANTAASQIELVGDIIRHIEDRGTAPARRSAAQLVIPARTIVARAANYFLLSQDALIFLF